MKTIYLKSAEDTENVAAELALLIKPPALIYLEGQLGAGKTTFVKGFMRGLGYEGLVKSPTYTLVETYPINEGVVLHADLYRIKDSSELDHMGFRDYLNVQTIAIIEWASVAAEWLPKPMLLCKLTLPENGVGRVLEIEANEPLPDVLRDWIDAAKSE